MTVNQYDKVTERPDDLEVEPPKEEFNRIDLKRILKRTTSAKGTAVIILNQPIGLLDIDQIWNTAELYICADGGANRLYDHFKDEEKRACYIPNFIVGDLDSLREEVKVYYQSKGTKVIPQYTQYDTDFNKSMCVAYLYFFSDESRSLLEGEIDNNNGLQTLMESYGTRQYSCDIYYYILGGINGRFDQTIRSVIEIYRLSRNNPKLHLFLISEYDIVFIAKKGSNFVEYGSKSYLSKNKETIACGMLPFCYQPISISTLGLKYDVKDWETEMSNDVSTSNYVVGNSGFILNTTEDILMNISVEDSSLLEGTHT